MSYSTLKTALAKLASAFAETIDAIISVLPSDPIDPPESPVVHARSRDSSMIATDDIERALVISRQISDALNVVDDSSNRIVSGQPPVGGDGERPTAPVLRALGAIDTAVALLAESSTDNEVILSYRWDVSDNSGSTWREIANQNILHWVCDGLQPDTEYLFRLTCIDWSGLESEPSNTVAVRTLAGLSNKVWYVKGYDPMLDIGDGATKLTAWNGPRRIDYSKLTPGDTVRVIGNCRADAQIEGRFWTMPKGLIGITFEGDPDEPGIISSGTNSIATSEADFDGPPDEHGIYTKSNVTGNPGWLWCIFDDHLPGHLPPQMPLHRSRVPLHAGSPENSWYWDSVEKKFFFKALGGLDGKLPFRNAGDSVMTFNEAAFCTVRNLRVAYGNGFNLLNSAAIAFENVDMHMGMWMGARIRNCHRVTFDGGEWSWVGTGPYGDNDKKDTHASSFCAVRNLYIHDTMHDPLAFTMPTELVAAYNGDSHGIGWQNGTDNVFEDNIIERCNSAITIWMGGWIDGSTSLHNRQDAMSRISIRRNVIRECRLRYAGLYDWVNVYSALGRGIEIVGSNWANDTAQPGEYLNAGNARGIVIAENDIRGCDRGSIYIKVGTYNEDTPSVTAGNNYIEQRIEYSVPDNRVIGNTPPVAVFYVNAENAVTVPTRSGGHSALSDNYGAGADMLVNGDIRYPPEYADADLYAPPTFRDGHTLLPLTRCAWGTPYDIGFELEENWGFALEFSQTGMRPPYTNADYTLNPIIVEALRREAEDGRRRKKMMYTARPIYWDGDWQAEFYIGDLLPESAWMHIPGDTPYIEERRIPVGTSVPPDPHRRLELSPLMSDEAISVLAEFEYPRMQSLKERGVPQIDIVLNMAEYSPGVPGHSNVETRWRADPEVLAWWNELQLIPYDGSAYYPGRVPGRDEMMASEHEYVSRLYEAKNKLEPAVAAACKRAYPDTTYINYGTGDVGEGILSWRPRSAWGFPYWMAKAHTDLPSWEFYRGYHKGWMDGDKGTLATQVTNAAAIQTEGGNGGLGATSNISYNWIGMGWVDPSLHPEKVAPDIEQFGFLKFMYVATGAVGCVIGYFQQPLWETGGHPAWLDVMPAPGAQDWLRQCLIAGHVHAAFSHLERYIRDGDVLQGDGQHHLSRDVYSRPVWPHASYEFAHELGMPTAGAYYKTIGDHSDNAEYPTRAKVVARKLRGAEDYLVCAWSCDGVTRALHPTIPGLGRVKVAARPGGTLYRMRPAMPPVLLDPIADDPSRYIAQLLEG